MQRLCFGDRAVRWREQRVSTINKKSTWPARSLPAGRNNVAKRMSREWSTFVITGLGKNSPRRFHGGGDTAACEHGPGVKIRQTRRLGGSSQSQAAGESWGDRWDGSRCQEIWDRASKVWLRAFFTPIKQQPNLRGRSRCSSILVALFLQLAFRDNKKTRKLGTFLSCQKSKFGNCPSRTDHEPHQ